MRGIVPSLNTPFLQDGSVDQASLRRLVNHTVDAGCGGMLGLAVAGEHSTLSLAEKAKFIDTVTDTNAQRIPFVVSVTAVDLAGSIELAKLASANRAAGICVQFPTGLAAQDRVDFLQELSCHAPGILMVQDLDWAGSGLAIGEIVDLTNKVDKFTWLKIETPQAGQKYSAVLKATDGALNVCGGWAVTQLMDAMARGVQAFIPTGMESVYVAIYRLYTNGDIDAARTLFNRALPILNFSNQHIDISIRFFKELRKAEGLFDTAACRVHANFDAVQQREASHALKLAMSLCRETKQQNLNE